MTNAGNRAVTNAAADRVKREFEQCNNLPQPTARSADEPSSIFKLFLEAIASIEHEIQNNRPTRYIFPGTRVPCHGKMTSAGQQMHACGGLRINTEFCEYFSMLENRTDYRIKFDADGRGTVIMESA
ncbi:hypothetical protein [Burkholderia cepacia]|uniref:hypothetical protein n=1 Tax=Burkholderia cepacia TaxID=292 RepID=UPI002FE037EF